MPQTFFHVGDRVFDEDLKTVAMITNIVVVQPVGSPPVVLGYDLRCVSGAAPRPADRLKLVEAGPARLEAEAFAKNAYSLSL